MPRSFDKIKLSNCDSNYLCKKIWNGIYYYKKVNKIKHEPSEIVSTYFVELLNSALNPDSE